MPTKDPTIEPALTILVAMTGLEKTHQKFPEDVAVAFKTVAKLRAAATGACDPLTEFWPPMRVKE